MRSFLGYVILAVVMIALYPVAKSGGWLDRQFGWMATPVLLAACVAALWVWSRIDPRDHSSG